MTQHLIWHFVSTTVLHYRGTILLKMLKLHIYINSIFLFFKKIK
jgi:hypothetical protein